MGIKFAILAPGTIARSIAVALKAVPELERYAVASRKLEKAQEFAKQWGFEKAYGSYEEMLADPKVEFVYIASPHSCHYEHAKLCLQYGKHVLVEKAFTVNRFQAKELVQLAREKKCLLAEAIWTRYMPSRQMILELLHSEVIGEYRMLTANLGYQMTTKERLINPMLAGGALLDVGVYPINFALMSFGNEIARMESSAQMTERGVDGMESITFHYKDGRMAQLFSTLYSATDRRGMIYGSKGYLEIDNINNPQVIRIYNLEHELMEQREVPKQVNGYEYELQSCVRALKSGQLECTEMPLEETLRVMEILDSLRQQWGFRYPEEIERV